MSAGPAIEDFKTALGASILSRAWGAALSVLAVPVYLRFLGVESFGVVGVFTTLSALIGFMDLGLGSTLTRELARLGNQPSLLPQARDTARTLELAYVGVALLIGLLVAGLSGPITHHWVQAESLSPDSLARAIALSGLALACQWPGGLYSAGLAGLHRQTELAVLTAVMITLRVGITVLALWQDPVIEQFFIAQALAGLVHTLSLRWLLWRRLALPDHGARFSAVIIRDCLAFAGGMTGIAITSILITQTDKLVLSHALSLSEFGIYSLATALTSGLYMLIGPMFSMMYPRLTALRQAGDEQQLAEFYLDGSQAMALLVLPAAAVIGVFAFEVLQVWTGDARLSREGAWVLSMLILGNACNGLMNMPYALQLASGWTRLPLWVNIVSLPLLVPAIWLAATRFGALGGAAAWAGISLCLLFVIPMLMHRRLLRQAQGRWFIGGVLLPAALCVALVVGLHALPLASGTRPLMALQLGVWWALVSLVLALALPRTRAHLGLLLAAVRRRPPA